MCQQESPNNFVCGLPTLFFLLRFDLLLFGLSDLANPTRLFDVSRQFLLSQIFLVGNLQDP